MNGGTTEQAVRAGALDLLHLSTVPGLGQQRIRNLMRRFHSVEAIFKASIRELVEVEGIDRTLAQSIKRGGDRRFAETQALLLKKAGAAVITFWDSDYPSLLRRISDPPLFLFVKGSIAVLKEPCVAIVGTRSPTSYGKAVVENLAAELARNGITIVSGLARGIDTSAHRAVLQAGGKTAAVLGSGVDYVYPEENRHLAEEITAGGAVISEFPMGTKPEAPYFPRRNRIISGLSLGTLVIEAGAKSGALITADQALEQGREVFAVPGNINSPKSVGCNALIQQGAKLVLKVEDILEELHIESKKPAERPQEPLPNLSEKELRIYLSLSHEPLHIDKIAAASGLPVGEVLGILLSLELKNVVLQTAGKHFMRR